MTSNEQTRADAMADAETLLRVAQIIEATGALDSSDTGIDFGGLSQGYSIPRRVRMGHHNTAARYVREAARAAFRAVPGLRG